MHLETKPKRKKVYYKTVFVDCILSVLALVNNYTTECLVSRMLYSQDNLAYRLCYFQGSSARHAPFPGQLVGCNVSEAVYIIHIINSSGDNVNECVLADGNLGDDSEEEGTVMLNLDEVRSVKPLRWVPSFSVNLNEVRNVKPLRRVLSFSVNLDEVRNVKPLRWVLSFSVNLKGHSKKPLGCIVISENKMILKKCFWIHDKLWL